MTDQMPEKLTVIYKAHFLGDGAYNAFPPHPKLDGTEYTRSDLMGWVSVDERLPEQNLDVFVMTDRKGARKAYQDNDGWFDSQDHGFYGGHSGAKYKTSVTHWMPIPPLPNNKEDG